TPAGFDKAIESLTSSNRASSAFQAAGFWAWFAYFLATSRDNKIEQSLSQLSEPALQYVVTEVSKVKADPSLGTRFQHTFYGSNRALRRRRLFQASKIELPGQPSSSASEPPFSSPEPNLSSSPPDSNRRSPSPEPNPSKRPRLEPSHHSGDRQIDTTRDIIPCLIDTDVQPLRDVSDTLAYRRASQEEMELTVYNETRELPTFKPNPEYQYAYPKAKNLPNVFPHDLCGNIVKRADEASLMVSYPSHPGQCELVVDIRAIEVQYYAFKLFGLHIRPEDQQRVVVSQNGATMTILGSLKLGDSSHLTWGDTLGDTISKAVQHSPERLRELERA
ncbi:hypothetical protein CDV36_015532, partial [Fusarium kuroshium]